MKLRHRESGVETELSAGLELGRVSSCGLQIDDGSVSRHHARVELRGAEWWLADLGSSNGSKRNGRLEKEFPLRTGDLVTIGAVAFDVLGPAPAPAPAAARPTKAAPLADESADPELSRVARETEAERARIHAALRAKGRSGGFGDLSQLPLRMQILVAVIGVAFLAGVVLGVRWLGEAM
ncbi:MAG: FHA domain-containing protein [Planctomycetes bacterium]|nr:FHA domain-containing protein [Planctomycetota bacterium]